MTSWPLRVTRGIVLASLLFLAATASAAPPEYRLGPHDVIEVLVWGQPDLSGKYTVRTDGAFEFPLIGDVKGGGLTVAEIEANLRKRLGEGFLTSPQVTAKVIEFKSQQVFVSGEVGRQGAVPLSGTLTLLEALFQAGGAANTAGGEVVVLRRTGNAEPVNGPLVAGQPGVEELARVALDELQAGRARENIVLHDGDTIFIPKGGVVYLVGEVLKPGALAFERGLTVMQAVSAAGGATDHGAPGKARITRMVAGQRREMKAKPTDLLQPGDIVRVPSRWF
jgi:polysaccharide export outer membrane protein